MYICVNREHFKLNFMEKYISDFVKIVAEKNPNEPEFLQTVKEVAETILPFMADKDIYKGKNILLRMTEPERVIIFRVCWEIGRASCREKRREWAGWREV